MEVYLPEWSSPGATTILEPLQPLSIDIDVEEKCIKDLKVENISRGETVNNLIAELDKFKDETEPFYNWVEPEKFQWPILDDYYSATYNDDIKLNDFAVFAGSYNSAAQNNASFQDFPCNAPVSATLPATLEVPSIAEKCNDNDHVFASSPFVSKSKEEILTPPNSPKEEQEAGEEAAEIFKLLEEMNPEVLDEFVRSSQAGHGLTSPPSSSSSSSFSSSSSEVGSECGGSILDAGEFSDGCASSPFVSSSDSGIDEQISSPICLLQVVPSTSAEGYCCEDSDAAGSTVVPLKRKRSYHHQPYARVAGEEKRLRKKEQNKNAATRYRMKKKAEVEGILSEEKDLEDKNKRLHEEVDEICREIKYLKSLMREVYKAKGLVK